MEYEYHTVSLPKATAEKAVNTVFHHLEKDGWVFVDKVEWYPASILYTFRRPFRGREYPERVTLKYIRNYDFPEDDPFGWELVASGNGDAVEYIRKDVVEEMLKGKE